MFGEISAGKFPEISGNLFQSFPKFLESFKNKKLSYRLETGRQQCISL